jgi:chromosome segregation ATPase
MEASHGTEPRVIRLADAPEAIEFDPTDLLARLEAQAEENGRLRAHAESMERLARSERDARRRLAETLKRERRAAGAVHRRAERAEARQVAQAEEVERLSQVIALTEQQMQAIWTHLSIAERPLALPTVPLWRRLLRRPPRA